MPLNPVNLRAKTSAIVTLVVQHLNKVGVLASVLMKIREAGINVAEIQNVIFDGAPAACATLQLHSEPSAELIEAIAASDRVIGVQRRAL